MTGPVELRTTSCPTSSLVDVDVLAQCHDGSHAGLLGWKPDRGERRCDHGRHRYIIETDDTHAVRHGDPTSRESRDDPECHLVVERDHSGHRAPDQAGHCFSGRLEGRSRYVHHADVEVGHAAGLADSTAALGSRPRSRRTAQEGERSMTESGQVEQRVLHCGGRPEQDRPVPGHGPVDEHRRFPTESVEFAVEPAGRQDHEAIDVGGEGSGRPDLLVGVFAGVCQEDLQFPLAGGALDGPDHRPEVRVRDVRDDDGDVAGPTRLHHLRRPVRNKTKLRHCGLNPPTRVGRHLLGPTQGSGHRSRMHANPSRDIEDRDASMRPHNVRRYPEGDVGP